MSINILIWKIPVYVCIHTYIYTYTYITHTHTYQPLTVLLWGIEVLSIIYPARCLKCLQHGHLSWPLHSWPTRCLPFTPFSALKISAKGKHSAFELSLNQVTVSLQLPGELSGWNQKLAHIEGGQRPKEEADRSTLVGGKFNKQGNLHTKLVLDGHRRSRSLHLLSSIFKNYFRGLKLCSFFICFFVFLSIHLDCHLSFLCSLLD